MRFLGLLVCVITIPWASGCDSPDIKKQTPEKEPAIRSSSPTHNFSKEQACKLAEIIITYTPEHTHFVSGTTFSLVLLSSDIKSNPPELNEAVIALLRQKYKVYFDEKDIPAEHLIRRNDGKIEAFKDGFKFSFKVEFENDYFIKVYYCDFEAPLAASEQWVRYMWAIGEKKWDPVDASKRGVA